MPEANLARELRRLVSQTQTYLRFLEALGWSHVPRGERKTVTELPARLPEKACGQGEEEELISRGAENSARESSESPSGEVFSSPKEALLALRDVVLPCVKCKDLARNRRNVVFGSGDARAKLVFVGEAPGETEDRQGLPFVGKAGELLTKIIESIGLSRKEVFITNVLKCRPPGNRNPLPEEILNCEPYLVRQLEIIQPKIICTLGNVAAQAVLKTGKPISELRGRLYFYRGIPVLPTFHPAFLLRNPNHKRLVWEDMKLVKSYLSK